MEYWNNPELMKKIRRRRKKPKIGDYVIFSRWSDLDANDPWYVGIVEDYFERLTSISFKPEGHHRFFPISRIITREEGDIILGIKIKNHFTNPCKYID